MTISLLSQQIYRYNSPMNRGFSLVELSIVLVILGLLTGGILAGQSLIRAAELRAVTSEYQRYMTAVQTFRDKYFALPGDMANATRFWGDDNAACADAAVPNGSPGTCNGNGSGQLSNSAGANTTGELFQFWKQLALAGLIEGSYTGLSGSGGGQHSILGTNVPPSRLGNAGWSAYFSANFAGNAEWFAYDYQNMLVIGSANATDIPYSPVFKPEEAWNIDTKMDDGKPGQGKVMALWNNCTDAAGFTALTANYALTTTSNVCRLVFPKAF